MNNEIPYIYILLYSKLKEKAVISPYVSMKFIDSVFNQYLRNIPKIIRSFIIEDMAELKLLQKINKRQILILNSDCYKDLNNYKKYNKWITSLPD